MDIKISGKANEAENKQKQQPVPVVALSTVQEERETLLLYIKELEKSTEQLRERMRQIEIEKRAAEVSIATLNKIIKKVKI